MYCFKSHAANLEEVLLLVKNFLGTMLLHSDDAALMNSVLTNCIEKFIHFLSITYFWFLLRVEVVKITTFSLSIYRSMFRNTWTLLVSIWQLLVQNANIYEKVTVNQSEQNLFPVCDIYDDQKLKTFTTLTIYIFEFIQCTIEKNRKVRIVSEIVLTDLKYILFVYIQVIEE